MEARGQETRKIRHWPSRCQAGGILSLIVMALGAAVGGSTPRAWGDNQDKALKEYEFKAACIYNLIKYTTWPQEENPEKKENDPQKNPKEFVIGVAGKDPFGKSWALIENKKVGESKIVIRKFGDFNKIMPNPVEGEDAFSYEDLQKCQVLFIGKSEEKNYQKIINVVQKASILTISEEEGFLEKGGIVNFLLEKKKVRFEINLDAAKLAKLSIKTSVLKLAKRVIQQKKNAQ